MLSSRLYPSSHSEADSRSCFIRTLLLSSASIVTGIVAIFTDRPKRYAALSLTLALLLLGTAGFLSEGEIPIFTIQDHLYKYQVLPVRTMGR
jgi:hypothetical protein